MSIQNNLYPPLMKTYMPAYSLSQGKETGEFRIYFSISNFNSLDDICYPQIYITNQKTNKNAFSNDDLNDTDTVTVCDGIYFSENIGYDSSVDGDYKYYVTIRPGSKGKFVQNTYYKVQIRFTNSQIKEAGLPSSKNAGAWLVDNSEFFSEWSTVCLIRFIDPPTISINGLDFYTKQEIDSRMAVYQSKSTGVKGKVIFNNGEEDYLKSYQITLLDLLTEKEIVKSDILYPRNKNEIDYEFEHAFIEGNGYLIKLDILTYSMFSKTLYTKFIIIRNGDSKINCHITAVAQNDYGRMKVIVNGEKFIGNYTIRRADNKTNYTVWKDVFTGFITNDEKLDFVWYDYTVESGVYYKYCIQKRRYESESRGAITESNHAMVYLDAFYINGSDKQLKLSYNTTISSIEETVLESKVETLGSKYPFITRNADVKYKTLSINGLVTVLNDIYGDNETFHKTYGIMHESYDDYKCSEYLTPLGGTSLFTSYDDMFGSSNEYDRYENYVDEHGITLYTNRIYEKIFREKVVEFLYDGKAKLIRTPDEGNIIVKLMSISFTPNSTLNGLIYDFSAQAIEIDESSVNNYELYNIQSIGELKEEVYNHFKLGQVIDTFKKDVDFKNILLTKYKNNVSNSWDTTISHLSYLKIEFLSEPYYITAKGGVSDVYTTIPVHQYNNNSKKPIAFGYLMRINGKQIIVPAMQKIYVLRGEDIRVESLSFCENTKAEIDYIVNLEERETEKEYASIYYNYNIGQLWGTFEPKALLKNEILAKHVIKNNDYYQSIISINGVEIEADEGVICYIRERQDSDYNKHIMNNTNILSVYDESSDILNLYFDGRRFYKNTNITNNGFIPYNKFEYIGRVTSTKSIVPNNNEVYYDTVKNKYFIYYNNMWYECTLENSNINNCTYIEASVPVDGIVNYLFETEKGVY